MSIYSRECDRWSSKEHAAAALALGDFAILLMAIHRDCSDEREGPYLIAIGWAARQAAQHAAESINKLEHAR